MAESGTYDLATIQRRQKLAEQMSAQAIQPRKIDHWMQGLAQLGEVGAHEFALNRLDKQEKEGNAQAAAAMISMLGGGSPATPAAVPVAPSPTTTPSPAPSPGGDDVGYRMRMVESGGDPNAKNPNSSATGPDQFINSTWLETIKKNRPDLAAGKTDAELLALRTDEKLSGEMRDAYANNNRSILANAGLPTTPGATYLAHFAGPGGAQKVLSADPKTQVAMLLAPEAVRANPFLKGMTAGDLKGWADRKMGGSPAAPVTAASVIGQGGAPVGLDADGTYPADAVMLPEGPVPGRTAVAQAMTPTAPAPSSPAPTQATDARSRIIAMLSDKNPVVRRMGQQYAQAYIQKNIVGSEDTNDIKEQTRINAERKAAGQPPIGLLEYQTKLKEAGKPVTNINQQQESEFQKGAGKFYSERYGEMVKGASEANDLMADIGNIRDLGSRINTGKTAEVMAALGPYAEALGIKIDGLGEMQAYNAIISKMAPRMRPAGSGATSDFEMKGFLQSLPGLGKTPQGNEIIANTFQAIQQHKIAAGEIANRALSGEITRTEAEKQIKALGDPLALWKKTKGALPTQTSASGGPSVDDLLKKYGQQ